MHEKIRILMTDDHPIIIEGYQNTLLATKKETQELQIDIANTCDQSITLMQKSREEENPYTVLFMDISLPPSADGSITSGEDLSKYARTILPNAKIVILTMFNEPYRIHNIIKEIKPEGFVIKSDLTSRELASAFQAVINNPPFYSTTVTKYLQTTLDSEIEIDDIDRKILYLLSQGIKTKSLTKHLGISTSSVEKRKKNLKEVFYITDSQDETLLIEARKKGFL
ncbi:DNA-binding response regulator [Oceanihabitans sp. 2_MG-2023]|uniref:DNA-binding response regulator n=1 Tax=Oceanihabitans sp. 2_MG-2023 TaxID=3062661 RepID=UPI0026E254F2|nr:DNA-binding response regulator [Oceanihabitans sp. 2_MG-2023]MDO6595466.1 DNA-binding response regulator [Oceanihabitans sp. 2_MG-2023]